MSWISRTTPAGRRTSLAASALVLGALAAGLTACGSSDDSAGSAGSAGDAPASGGSGSASLGSISVQLSWIKNSEFAGEFIADSKGYYKDAGFSSVDLVKGPVATETLVASGKATFGLSNAVSTATAIANSGAPLKIVGTTYQKNPFTILSLADKGNITTPQDMIGKKIGVQDSNASLFDALLKANGIDKSQVTVVPVGYDPSVLEQGQVDGYVGYLTNEALIVKGDGYKITNLPFADNGLPFVAESVITTDQEIKDHPDVVKGFLQAEIKGWKDACNGSAGYKAGAQLAVDDYGKDEKLTLSKEIEQAQEQCQQLINTDETKKNGLFTISDDMVRANMDTLKAAGITISADQLFDLGPLTELLKEQPDLAK